MEHDGVFKSVCPLDCPDQCGLLLHKVDGRVVKVEGDPEHRNLTGVFALLPALLATDIRWVAATELIQKTLSIPS
jgi:hypothetical protein